MSLLTSPAPSPDPEIEYPDSDGKPMADNTRQARWMTVLFGNLCALFRPLPDIFIAIDLLWYALRGHPEVRIAPDVLIVFGRPRGDRGSYKQWEEEGIPVTVAFEILSPGNTVAEMAEKFAFYEDHGVEEYYLYDPDNNRLQVYIRRGDILGRVRNVADFVSPRLGIRFDFSGPEMVVLYPDGRRFLTFEELDAERVKAEKRADNAEQRAGNAEQQANDLRQRMTRLRELSRKARHQQATPEDFAELERLENETVS